MVYLNFPNVVRKLDHTSFLERQLTLISGIFWACHCSLIFVYLCAALAGIGCIKQTVWNIEKYEIEPGIQIPVELN